MLEATTGSPIWDVCVNVNDAPCNTATTRTDLNGYAWFDLASNSPAKQYTFGFSHTGHTSTQITRTYTGNMGTVTFTIFLSKP